jgi:beta-N-acetylhexosaminidase
LFARKEVSCLEQRSNAIENTGRSLGLRRRFVLAIRGVGFVRVLPALAAVCLVAGAQPKGSKAEIQHLSSPDKLGQLMFVGFEGTSVTPDLRHLVADWHVGGIVLYAQNIESPEQVARLNHDIRGLAKGGAMPFIAIDQEGGSVRRLFTGVPQLPGAMALGATRSRDLTLKAGDLLGRSLRGLGFTMNFAPVLDVLSNPDNTALGTRAFSSDPELVASLGGAFIQGELTSGIIPVAKHFPGQGGTAGDSHYFLPTLGATREELDRREFIPFRAGIAAGVPAIMTAHIALPLVAETRDTPATLSHRVLTDILRHALAFDGLVITDELQMRAVQGHRKIGDVAVDALIAGSDMVMIVWDHHDREEIYTALKDAYASGKLPVAVVDRALRHIRDAKRHSARAVTRRTPSLGEQVRLVERIAEEALTAPSGETAAGLQSAKGVVFIGADGPLRQRFLSAPWISTPARVDDVIVQNALKTASSARVIVAAIASENDRRLLVELRRSLSNVHLVVICMGSPYLLAGIGNPQTVVYTYSDLPPFQIVAGRVLLDGKVAHGRLPIPSPFRKRAGRD